MTITELRALAPGLEVPDCACTVKARKICRCEGECDCARGLPWPPCRHVQSADHQVGLADWIAILHTARSEEYDDPPRPRAGAQALSRQARVAVYEERHEQGLRLFNVNDLWNHVEDLHAGVLSFREEDVDEDAAEDGPVLLSLAGAAPRKRPAGRLRNGRPNPIETLSSEGEAA